jgi:cysteinyl-tRNA synthetase
MSDRWLWENARDRLSENTLAHPHQFDIHGGGIDIIFPHHENEVAQSRCAHGTDVMAHVWMHNGMLQVEGQKMSKSEGNFFTINKVLQDWPGGVFRFNMLRTHYRQPIDWTFKGLEECENVLRRWQEEDGALEVAEDTPGEEFLAALLDDLNTPLAITTLHQLEPEQRRSALAMLGLDQPLADPRRAKVDEAIVEREIAARIAARKTKNWTEADRIRDELVAMGIVLMDGKDPETGEFVTKWEIAR